MCDPGDYGRFIAYKFPKEKRILGPQQVETKIDQDSYLSGQLTLWDQRGSRVIRGNVLAIPVGDTLIYVEPIYLQAETAAYPELRLVAVMHNDDLSYATDFETALKGLFSETVPDADTPEAVPGREAEDVSTEQLIREAGAAFDEYLDSMGSRDIKAAHEALDRLRNRLEELENRVEE
jgi:hypothetical protein